MARLTVEDCLQYVDNRFELVLKAAKRARRLSMGGEPVVPWDNDKPTVVALREIAAGYLSVIEELPIDEGRAVEEAFKEEAKGMAAEIEEEMREETATDVELRNALSRLEEEPEEAADDKPSDGE